MTSFQIVALYVALNLILTPILMFRVGQIRIKDNISLGDGDNPALLARIRAHANFTETAPIALIGLIVLAMMNAHIIALHIFGAAFFIGRLAHAHGMAQKAANGKGRIIGTLLTLGTFFGSAIYLLILVFTFNVT